MIDTYFDMVDARSGYKPKRSAPAYEDPLYYNGGIYATMLDRQCAVALDSVRLAVAFHAGHHLRETRLGILLGHDWSIFTTKGKRK